MNTTLQRSNKSLLATDKKLANTDLEKIVQAFTTVVPEISEAEAKEAVDRVLSQYKEQLATFMIGLAKAKMTRIIRLMNILEKAETQIEQDSFLEGASSAQKLRHWVHAQTSLTDETKVVQSILEIQKKTGDTNIIINNAGSSDQLIDSEEDILSPQERHRVRTLVSGFLDVVKNCDPLPEKLAGDSNSD